MSAKPNKISNLRWQFSIRSLLLLTAAISIVLAFAVKLPVVFRITLIVAAPVLLVVAILQSANFATSDRRPLLALLSWLMLGTFFTLYALAIFRMFFQIGGEKVGGPLIGFFVMAACAITCVVRACRSYLLIRRQKAANVAQAEESHQ